MRVGAAAAAAAAGLGWAGLDRWGHCTELTGQGMGWSGSATVGVCYRTGCNVVSLLCNVVSLRCNAHFGAQVYDCGVVDDQSVCAPHQLLGQQGACRVSHSIAEGTQAVLSVGDCVVDSRARADYSRRLNRCSVSHPLPLRSAQRHSAVTAEEDRHCVY